jgi:hypothetical protein
MSPLLRFPGTKCRQGKENGDPHRRPSAGLPGQFTRQRQIKAFMDTTRRPSKADGIGSTAQIGEAICNRKNHQRTL